MNSVLFKLLLAGVACAVCAVIYFIVYKCVDENKGYLIISIVSEVLAIVALVLFVYENATGNITNMITKDVIERDGQTYVLDETIIVENGRAYVLTETTTAVSEEETA